MSTFTFLVILSNWNKTDMSGKHLVCVNAAHVFLEADYATRLGDTGKYKAIAVTQRAGCFGGGCMPLPQANNGLESSL